MTFAIDRYIVIDVLGTSALHNKGTISCLARSMWRLTENLFHPHARYDSNSWVPTMSVQTYCPQNLDNEVDEERVPTPPLRGRTSSPPAAPFSQPSSSSLSSAHHEEMQSILQAHLDELTRAYQYEVAKQAWWGSCKVNISYLLRPSSICNLVSALSFKWINIGRDTFNFIHYVLLIIWVLHLNGECLDILYDWYLHVYVWAHSQCSLWVIKTSSTLITPLMERWNLTSRWWHMVGGNEWVSLTCLSDISK